MESNKTVIVALSLSVLTLAAVSTFLSLRQSGVLGESTVSVGVSTAPIIKPSVAPVPSLCKEIVYLHNSYCDDPNNQNLDKDKEDDLTPTPTPKEQKDLPDEGKNKLCGDIYKLIQAFCPKVTVGPVPSTTCRYGLQSVEPLTKCTISTTDGQKISGFLSANYYCQDGFKGTINSKICLTKDGLTARAKAACQGHGTCINPKITPITGGFCTGDKDCKVTEYCKLPPVPTNAYGQDAMFRPGRCVPKGTGTITKVPITGQITRTVTRMLTPTSTTLTCGWCGRNCVAIRPGLKCPSVEPPESQTCVKSGTTCKIIYRQD